MSAETKKQKPDEPALTGGVNRSVEWSGILKAGVHAQRLVPGAVCVGGTAAALYAGHRISHDTDRVLSARRDHFKKVRAQFEPRPEGKPARANPPVLILGSIENVE